MRNDLTAIIRLLVAAPLLTLLCFSCGGKNQNPGFESVKIEQITIKPLPSMQEAERTLARAAGVLDSIRQGADFAAMASQYSEHSSAAHGGALTLVPGWMPAGFDDSVAAMADGQLSLVQTTPSVYIVALDSSQFLSVRSSHILIMPDTTRAWVGKDKAWKEAEEKAWDMYRRVKNGESLHDLAKEHSMDPGSAQNGGDLGWSKRNQFVREFEEVAFGQEEGAIHEPIKTRFGWHVIRTVKKKDQSYYLRMIEFKVPLSESDRARARKVAEQARSMALAGKKLEAVAEELAPTDEAAVSYSKPYEVRKNLLLPNIAQIIEKLEPGEISELISADNSFYFLRLADK